jgi:hypothetical protein
MSQAIPTRPGVFTAIRRWLARREVEQRMAGIQQAIESVEQEIDGLQAVAFFPSNKHAERALIRAESLKRERILLMRDFDQLSRAYRAM